MDNHSHWVATTALYQDKLIINIHSNPVFDQMCSLETRQGVTGAYWFQVTTLTQAAFIPIYIFQNYQSKLTIQNLKTAILQTIHSASTQNQ